MGYSSNYECINVTGELMRISPVILDYDFINNRPRGGSAKLDFFSYGSFDKVFDGVELKKDIFVKKDLLFFSSGVFLTDFSKLDKSIKRVAKMITDMNTDVVYIEDSISFRIVGLLSELKHSNIVLLEFINGR